MSQFSEECHRQRIDRELESHLCGHSPSASTPGSGHLRASAAWLRATGFHLVWPLGGGWGGSSRRLEVETEKEARVLLPPVPPTSVPLDTPSPTPFQLSWGSVTMSSRPLVPPAPRGGQGSLQWLAPGAAPSCPYLCKEFFHVTSPSSHWGESHFWPKP